MPKKQTATIASLKAQLYSLRMQVETLTRGAPLVLQAANAHELHGMLDEAAPNRDGSLQLSVATCPMHNGQRMVLFVRKAGQQVLSCEQCVMDALAARARARVDKAHAAHPRLLTATDLKKSFNKAVKGDKRFKPFKLGLRGLL